MTSLKLNTCTNTYTCTVKKTSIFKKSPTQCFFGVGILGFRFHWLFWMSDYVVHCYKLLLLLLFHLFYRINIRARSGTRSLRSSAVPFLDVPFRRTDVGKRSFSCAAPATWNSLPPAVINCDTLSVFKSRLKTHLFNTAYS